MRWHIDSISREVVCGWIYDHLRPDFDFELAIFNGDTLLGRGLACLPRPDLTRAGHPKERCGFSIPLGNAPEDISRLRILCLNLPNAFMSVVLHDPDPGKVGTRIDPYQSFNGLGTGSSDSQKKLQSIVLPSLRGCSVLDLGCNEGFFCHYALNAGATRVLGIDKSELFIAKAKLRFPDIQPPHLEFRSGSWWDLPDEKFDVILLLSAIHYEDNQKKLLDSLTNHLTPNGILVLECGVAGGQRKSWVLVRRSIDIRRFPTYPLLMDTLLDSYAVRQVGESVLQKGDPIPRYVFHCVKKKPIIGLIYGQSMSGKSTLLRSLRKYGSPPTFSSDAFFLMYRKDHRSIAPKSPLYSMIVNELNDNTMNKASAKIIALDAVQEFCRDFVHSLPMDEDMILVEGEVFCNDVIRKTCINEMKNAGAVVWEMSLAK